ncbi:AEC family transporter [Thiofilum flexile]|uniref:AEC family transporter n=1 Tax=Thiofilum flexile TaxID=125627 RepID=UPI0003704B14|nr:AEC family transporter [Thiofilum flexile]
MLAIAATLLPIFLLIGVGALAVKTQLMPSSAVPAIGKLVLYLALPALIFNNLRTIELNSVIEPYFLMAYGLGGLFVLIIGFSLSFLWLKSGVIPASIHALGMSTPNSVFIGYPIVMLTFHTPLAAGLTMVLLVENLLILPIVLLLLEYGSAQKHHNLSKTLLNIAKRIATNPLIIAIFLGLLWASLHLPMPEPIAKTLGMLGNATVALALIFIGASLASNKFSPPNQALSMVLLGKLFLHPLIVALLVGLLPDFDHQLQLAVILFAAIPMMSIYPIIGEHYGMRIFCTNTLFITTLLSFFSLTLVIHGLL